VSGIYWKWFGNFLDLRCKRYWILSFFLKIKNLIKVQKVIFWKEKLIEYQIHTWAKWHKLHYSIYEGLFVY
jgi:hypothetical protein